MNFLVATCILMCVLLCLLVLLGIGIGWFGYERNEGMRKLKRRGYECGEGECAVDHTF